MRYLYIILLSILLIGCNSFTEKEQIIVKVPVIVQPPEPPPLNRPKLPLEDINENTSTDLVVKYYYASIIILQGYSKYMEEILNSYRKPLDKEDVSK